MKLGIIGAGMIVNGLFQFIHTIPEIEIKAICATPHSIEKLQKICAEQNIPAYYTDIDELIQDPDIDTVYVAVPNHLHFLCASKALARGLDVIMEKPFTSNYREAEELAKLAHETHHYALEAVTTRYLPNVLKIKEDLPQMGSLKIVSMNYSQYSSRYDAFCEGNILPAFDPKKAGGALMDLNIYQINFALILFGYPEDIHYFPNVEKGIDTSGILILQYPAFKCVCIAAKDCKAPLTTTIQGDKGCIIMHSPANVISDFQLLMNTKGKQVDQDLEVPTQDYNQGKNRMYHEFIEFERILSERDDKAAEEALHLSLQSMKIQTKARLENNILFPADEI